MLGALRFPVAESRGRRYPELPHPYRNAFQRDRDRVLHARAFRRLENKTQVFTSPISDHFRNRLTQRNRAVFGRVVLIDMEVALHMAGHINQRMAAELLDHMIKKADPGADIINAGAIKVHSHPNGGFVSGAGYRSCAHDSAL